MDPLSQALAGGIAAQVVAKPKNLRFAFLIGALTAMLADLDIFIRSSTDPILSLEYHRHFTHSLIFVPVGGLIGALLFGLILKRFSFKERFTWASLGYLTAAPLDACTSYGTHLYWPFSAERTAWHLISIVDPIFTGTILILSLWALIRNKKYLCNIAVAFSLIYLLCGVTQRDKAEEVASTLASERSHQAERLSVKPSLGNIFLWRSIYREKDQFFVDAILLKPFSEPKIYTGGQAPAIDVEKEFANLSEDSRLKKDIKRFAFFSDYYLSYHPKSQNILGDLRYAMLPNSVEPLWGIIIDRDEPNEHIKNTHFRRANKKNWSELWRMLLGK